MNDNSFYHKWARFALFNFAVLAAVGVLLRYKILFPLPIVDQKHLLHGHSHFAFAGWVSLALYIAIICILQPTEKLRKQLEWLLVAQQMSSYGMLFTFPFTGYAAGSIAFSTASIFVSYGFAWLVLKELLKRKQWTVEKKWITAALLCNVVSSLGTFSLAYLMMTKNLRQDWYFGSVYFFLHFQYNGFFLFSIGAMLMHFLSKHFTAADTITASQFFNSLVIALVPAWFLSLMWMRIPLWMYYSAVAGALVQLAALWFFIKLLLAQKNNLSAQVNPLVKWFWLVAGAAFTIKMLLQVLSAVPLLNMYAFGLRPVVIGFLHLVLLVFVSVFLMGYLFQEGFLTLHRATKKAAWLFLTGVLLNELVLMMQGIAAISYSTIPYSNYLLLLTAAMILMSLLVVFSSNCRTGNLRR
ncbi:MAG: hypothetical protein K2X48_09900 [Chitinophagaceae bacterium]|nr:hypothetical protein [Chitinophagaceae bacterium]